jgi:hypothetical protein
MQLINATLNDLLSIAIAGRKKTNAPGVGL